ncbi:MAG: hypothetical protein GX491_16710 [Chloroflexi bacterium]|nr:hypothetical protein [Chloroflexota bacterium]
MLAPAGPPVGAVDCPTLLLPDLISPEDGAEIHYTAQDPYYRLEWEQVPGAAGYHLRVWDADTGALVIDEQLEWEGSDWYEVASMEGSFTWNVVSLSPVEGCPPSQPSETWAFTAAQGPPPAVPVNVSATDGAYPPDRIIVTWNQPESDSLLEQWQVRRATEPDPDISVEVAAVLENTYVDTNATPGVTYYYWIEACSHADGCSALSEPDVGYAAERPPAPVNVRATDGTFPRRIDIDWDPPPSGPPVDHYLVYRATRLDKEYAVPFDESTNTHSISDSVTPGVVYYFWVRACAQGDNCSAYSEPESGYAGAQPVEVDEVFYLPCILR